MQNLIMKNKKGLVAGIANKNSIAWGIAKSLVANGAQIVASYQSEAQARRLKPLLNSIGMDYMIECDVSNSDSIADLFDNIKEKWGKLDFVIHSIAYSDKEELKGRYVDTTPENFQKTLDISCYSFTKMAAYAEPLMIDGGSLVTLTYQGARKVMPSYNVMGVAKAALEASVKYLATDLGKSQIRVNAISAGPMRTLSGKAITNSGLVYSWQGENSPLRKNVSLENVGGAAVYLTSDLGSGVTGEILSVDSGYNIIGMAVPNINYE